MNTKNTKRLLLGTMAFLVAVLALLFVSTAALADVINVDNMVGADEDDDDQEMNDAMFLASDRGDGVGDIDIEVYDSDEELVDSGTTDDDGELMLKDFDRGDYSWKAFSRTDEIDEGTFDIAMRDEQVQGAALFVSVNEEDYDQNDLILGTNNPYGTGEADVTIDVYDGSRGLVASGTTDYEGIFFISELPKGWYDFEVSYDSDVFNTGKVYSYGLDPDADGTIKGQATDLDNGDTIANTMIYLFSQNELIYMTWTDEDGDYEVEVQPDDYYIMTNQRMYEGYRSQNPVTVNSGDTVTHDFELDKKAMLYGYVTENSRGDAIPNALVELEGEDDYADTDSRPDGYYELWVTAGKYDLTATHDDYEDYESTVALEDDDRLQHDIRMTKGAEKDARVYGYVTDKDTGDAVEDAEVQLYDSDDDEYYYDYTDDEGYYSIDCYGGKTYDMSVYHEDYYTHKEKVAVEIAEEKQVDVELQQKPLVYGYVTDADTGDPVEDAEVDASGEDWNYDYTDSEGYYEMRIAEGDYTLYVYHDDYTTHDEEFSISNDDELQIDVELEPKGAENSKLYGLVTDAETGDPIERAEVDISNNDDYYYTYTDSEGYYEIKCRSGEYDVYVYADGYETHYGEVAIKEDDEVRYDVEMTSEGGGDDSLLYGYVTDAETEDPISDASVELQGEDERYYTETDDSGYYEIQCSSGKYTIYVSHKDYQTHENQIIVEEEEQRYDVELEPKGPEDCLLYGYVTDADTGDPVVEAGVDLYNDDDYYYTYTDKDGYYEIECRSGDYTVYVYHDDYQSHEGEVSIGEQEQKQYDVELEPKGPEDSSVYGTVTDADTKEPIGGATVYLYNDDEWYDTETDRSGEYRIACRAGDYSIEVHHNNYESHYGKVPVGEQEDVQYDVELERSGGQKSYIEGYIYDENSEDPVPGADIQLYNGETYSDRSDEDGYYYISCDEGDYTITVTHEDYEKYEDDVYVGPDGTEYDAYITPKGSGRLYGYVTDKENDDPLEEAKVTAERESDGQEFEILTDEEGYYELELPTGEFDITVYLRDYHEIEDTVKINDGDEIQKDYELERDIKTGKIYGDVKDVDSGERLEGVKIILESQGSRGKSYDTETDADGDYEIRGVDEGDYDVTVEFDGYDTIYDTVTVVENGVEKKYRMETKKATVYGKVTDKDGDDPLNDVLLTLTAKGRGEEYTVETNHTGEYTLDLPGDDYTVTAEHEDYITEEDEVTLTDGEETELDFELELMPREGTIYGYISEKGSGTLLKGVKVTLTEKTRSGNSYDTTTDAEGEYEITVPEGDYEISVELEDYETETDTVTLADDDRVEKNYQLVKDENPDKDMEIDTDAGDELAFGDEMDILITVTEITGRTGAAVGEATLTIELDNYDAADLAVSPGALETNANGEYTIIITAMDVDSETIVILTITADKDGYKATSYTKEITIIPGEAVEVVGPETGSLDAGAYYEVSAGVTGDGGEIDVAIVDSPDSEDKQNIGIFMDITFDGDEDDLSWVLIKVYYTDIPNGISENNLKIYYWDEDTDKWVTAEETGIDSDDGGDFVWANVTHLTVFAPRDPTGEVELNYDFSLTGAREANVKAGEQASYELTIENTGDEEDTYDLSVSGVKDDWGSLSITEVTLEAEDDKTFSVSVTVPEEIPAGTYTLKIEVQSQGDEDLKETLTLTVVVESENTGDSPGFELVFVAGIFLAVAVVRRKRE